MLPVDYLDNGEIDFSKCIGLFSYYNQNNPGGNPAVNATLTSLGYNVRRGWLGAVGGLAAGAGWG